MPKHVVVIGDSTIDNKVWVPREQSVVAQLSTKLGVEYVVHDYANDGFTTTDVLNGAYKDKAVRGSIYPHTHFKPLVAADADIKRADAVVVSVGGNNFREFLGAIPMRTPMARFIKAEFPKVIEKMKREYREIVTQIRRANPKARIILMTQYYPSVDQNTYRVYEGMGLIGQAMSPTGGVIDPMAVIHQLMGDIYTDIIRTSEKTWGNVVIADINASLNPFDSTQYVSQIEPSASGGEKIAAVLDAAVKSNAKLVVHTKEGVIACSSAVSYWRPVAPGEIRDIVYSEVSTDRLAKIFAIFQSRPVAEEASAAGAGVGAGAAAAGIGKLVIDEEEIDGVVDLASISSAPAFLLAMPMFRSVYTQDNINMAAANEGLRLALTAAYQYLTSGRFGLFRTHGERGRRETVEFVKSLLASPMAPTEEEIQKLTKTWLRSSGVNNSSRLAFAVNLGLFAASGKHVGEYPKKTEARKVLKARIMM